MGYFIDINRGVGPSIVVIEPERPVGYVKPQSRAASKGKPAYLTQLCIGTIKSIESSFLIISFLHYEILIS